MKCIQQSSCLSEICMSWLFFYSFIFKVSVSVLIMMQQVRKCFVSLHPDTDVSVA